MLIHKVGFTFLLTTAAVWLVSLPMMPEATDTEDSLHTATHEQLQAGLLEYPAAVQAEF